MRVVVKELPAGIRQFHRRLRVEPFQSALGFTAIWAGVASFFGWTVAAVVMNSALPPGLVVAFNIMYFVSGVSLVLGRGWDYHNLEAFGLITLLTSLIVRTFSTIVLVGFTLVTTQTIVQTLTFGIACVIRVIAISKGQRTVMIETSKESGDFPVPAQ